MNCDVTVRAEDFKTIHNTLWEMQYRGMPSEQAAERIREALKDAYHQEHRAFEVKHEHFDAVRVGAGFKSIWSIYEVSDLSQPHPYTAAEICYRDHWGDGPVYETIGGSTWADLYAAADRCIQRSGDTHHIFIEAFEPVAGQPHQLRLTTGS
jgi:hypothetical protein